MSIIVKTMLALGLFAAAAWAVESCCGMDCCNGQSCCRKGHK